MPPQFGLSLTVKVKRAGCADVYQVRYSGRNPPCTSRRILSHPSVSVQEQTVLALLHHPFQSFLEVFSCDSTASDDDPLVRMYSVESQCLHKYPFRHMSGCWCAEGHTLRTSSSLMPPETSVLFRNTRSPAPDSLSSSSRPFNSSRQSSTRILSVASTTHIKVSVFSK